MPLHGETDQNVSERRPGKLAPASMRERPLGLAARTVPWSAASTPLASSPYRPFPPLPCSFPSRFPPSQDYCIECPSTGSLFSLKDGSIVSWYPNNPVLRVLTPSTYCRPLEVRLARGLVWVGVDLFSISVRVGRVYRGIHAAHADPCHLLPTPRGGLSARIDVGR